MEELSGAESIWLLSTVGAQEVERLLDVMEVISLIL